MKFLRLLLLLLPRSHRAEYGDQLVLMVRDELSGTASVFDRAAILGRTALDLPKNALLAHLDVSRQDLRHAARFFTRNRGFALSVVAITALAIGANTTVFSVADQVLFRPMPYEEPHRLVKLWEKTPEYFTMEASPPNYHDWRDQLTTLQGIAGYHNFQANLVRAGEARRIRGVATEPELLEVLGAEPAMGRSFESHEGAAGTEDVVILSDAFWKSGLGADPAVLGQTIRLNDRPATVIGVMPPGFAYPSRSTELWRAHRFIHESDDDRDNNYVNVIARLKPGVSTDQLITEATTLAAALEAEYPETNQDTGIYAVSLRGDLPRQTRSLLLVLLAASLAVLLIACANLANLLLARALARRAELATRTALGAGRERLVRQMLTESGTLTLTGAALGIAFAYFGTPLLLDLVPTRLPLQVKSVLDLRVLGFALLLTLLTTLLFSLLPALLMDRATRHAGLLQTRTSAKPRRTLRRALVAAEISLSVALLSVSLLLVGALSEVQSIDPGFDQDNVVTLETPLPFPRYEATQTRMSFYQRVLSEVRSLPGVEAAGYTSFLPMTMTGGIWHVQLPGEARDVSDRRASLRFATEGYLEAMGINLLEGRRIQTTDTFEAPRVAVVSQSFLNVFLPGREALGSRFEFAFEERTIIGVVDDIMVRGLERRSEPQVYIPAAQVNDGWLGFYTPTNLVVRTDMPLESLVEPLRETITRADATLPLGGLRTMGQIVREDTAPRRSQLRLLAAFSLLALLLAALGIYVVTSLSAQQRRHEIGVRLALGSKPRGVLALFLKEAGLVYLLGGLAGLVLAFLAARAVKATVLGGESLPLWTLIAALALAGTATLFGSILPAWRASRTSPTQVLQES